MKKRVRGFTLVELIVVVAVISLLSVSAMVFLRTNNEQADNSVRQNDIQTVEAALGSQSKLQGKSFAVVGTNLVLTDEQRAAIQDKNLYPPSGSLDLHPIDPALAEYLSLTEEQLSWYAVDDYNRVYFLGFPAGTTDNPNQLPEPNDNMDVTAAPIVTARPTQEPPTPAPTPTDPPDTLGPGETFTAPPIPTPTPNDPLDPGGYFNWEAYVNAILDETRNPRDGSGTEIGFGSGDYCTDVNSGSNKPRGVCFYEPADLNGDGVQEGYFYIVITYGKAIKPEDLTDASGNRKYPLSSYVNSDGIVQLGTTVQLKQVPLTALENHLKPSDHSWSTVGREIQKYEIYRSDAGAYYMYLGGPTKEAGVPTSNANWVKIDATNVPTV